MQRVKCFQIGSWQIERTLEKTERKKNKLKENQRKSFKMNTITVRA